MYAKKRYGQHFLKSSEIAEQIVQALKISPGDNVLEIGPGRGALTDHLIQTRANIKAVEIDIDMITHLYERYGEQCLEIVEKNFLALDLSKIFDGEPFLLIGNYPYNISSQIIFKMLENPSLIPRMVGMFQYEMARRIISPPGSKEYGIISVFTDLYYESEMILKLKPGHFNPPPKVDSAVIRLALKRTEVENLSTLKQVVKQSFAQRRKKMRNSLKSLNLPEDQLEDDLLNARPETLSPKQFLYITNKLKENERPGK